MKKFYERIKDRVKSSSGGERGEVARFRSGGTVYPDAFIRSRARSIRQNFSARSGAAGYLEASLAGTRRAVPDDSTGETEQPGAGAVTDMFLLSVK